MEKRRLGRTGHMSSVAIFGAACLKKASQSEADALGEFAIGAGINHIDVAPMYGLAEQRLGPWLRKDRDRFFLGCKTAERDAEGAAEQLRTSLRQLQVGAFDLYQLHMVNTLRELDQVTGPGGALEAIREARAEGLTRYVGITGHGQEEPRVLMEALERFDFDTVLFPVHFGVYANAAYRRSAEKLLATCRERDVGVMAIKAIAKGPWGEQERRYATWYEPLDNPRMIQRAVNFALSQDVTGLCTAGDPTIMPLFVHACERFVPMSAQEQGVMIADGAHHKPFLS